MFSVKSWIRYFLLQLKRSLLAFSRMAMSIICMVLITVLLAWGVSSRFENLQMRQKTAIGVILPENDDMTGKIVSLISGMDSVRSICTFSFLTQEEADRQLKSDEIQAAVGLPQGFYDDVNTGVNTPVTMYFSNNSNSSVAIFKELLNDGLSYLRVTEAAIYSLTDLSDYYAMNVTISEMEEYLSLLYIGNIFARGTTFNSTVLSATGEVNITQYYIIVGLLAFLMLFGLNFSFLFKKNERVLNQQLRRIGVGALPQTAARTLVMTIYIYAISALTYLASGIVCNIMNSSTVRLRPAAFLCMIPVSLCIAAFFNMIFAFAGNASHGALLLLCVNLFMLILSGGILPSAYFPKWMQTVGEKLPLAHWMTSFQHIFFSKELGTLLVIELVMAAAFFAIASAVSAARK